MNADWLYEAHTEMVDSVKAAATTEVFNWHWDLQFPASKLEAGKMPDVAEQAEQWRNPVPAADMYFSHGQYCGDGLQHIIDELTHKPTSNRALYSLLAQKDISGSGDKPIPSFLTFQCSIEKSTLYCTASFRALEVSNFLKINLEEIRQNLVVIYGAFPAVETIHLHIFAFHAYVRTAAAAALRRPKIDVTPEAQLLRLMQKGDTQKLDELLGGLAQSTTVISPDRLKALLGILQMADAGLHESIQSKRARLEAQVQQSIVACNELAESRKAASRGVPSKVKIENFHAAVKKIQDTLLND